MVKSLIGRYLEANRGSADAYKAKIPLALDYCAHRSDKTDDDRNYRHGLLLIGHSMTSLPGFFSDICSSSSSLEVGKVSEMTLMFCCATSSVNLDVRRSTFRLVSFRCTNARYFNVSMAKALQDGTNRYRYKANQQEGAKNPLRWSYILHHQ
jgi:hypothetical protein